MPDPFLRNTDRRLIPEGFWKLAGGKTLKASRPPVTGKMNFPPRMGRRNGSQDIPRAPAGAQNAARRESLKRVSI
jgi:hypothetical protein